MFMLLKNAKLLNIKQLCKLNTLYFLNQLHVLAEQINNFPVFEASVSRGSDHLKYNQLYYQQPWLGLGEKSK